jgi:hypothetical protein
MRPADAVRQLEYAVETDDYDVGYFASMYEDVFADVTERGDLSDTMAVIERLGSEFTDDSRPSPSRAQTLADTVLTSGGRPLTDGGDGSADR